MAQDKRANIVNLPVHQGQEAGNAETAGAFLAKNREAKRLSLFDVSDATKIKADHIIAIEQTRPDLLPSTPYAIGFVKAYALYLGLDGESVALQFRKDIGKTAPTPIEAAQNTSAVTDSDANISEGLRMASVFAIVAVLIFVGWVSSNILSQNNDDARTENSSQRIIVAAEPAPSPQISAPTAIVPQDAGVVLKIEPAPIEQQSTAENPALSSDSIDENAVREDANQDARSDGLEDADTTIAQIPATTLSQSEQSNATSEGSTITAPVASPSPSDTIFPARLTRMVEPEYPGQCDRRAANLETVTVLFDVNTQGRATNPRVQATTNECFNTEALRTIARWRFNPKSINGEPVIDAGKSATLNFRQ